MVLMKVTTTGGEVRSTTDMEKIYCIEQILALVLVLVRVIVLVLALFSVLVSILVVVLVLVLVLVLVCPPAGRETLEFLPH